MVPTARAAAGGSTPHGAAQTASGPAPGSRFLNLFHHLSNPNPFISYETETSKSAVVYRHPRPAAAWWRVRWLPRLQVREANSAGQTGARVPQKVRPTQGR